MRGAIPPLTQYALMTWCLVQRRGNFTFTFHSFQRTRGQVFCKVEILFRKRFIHNI
jgi:hypothetical protein